MTGYPRDAGKPVEVLNKDGQPESCPSIQNYPLGLDAAMGGLLKDKVVVSGGMPQTNVTNSVTMASGLLLELV